MKLELSFADDLLKSHHYFDGLQIHGGQKWGLSPNMILWIYSTVVVLMIIYAALVWWRKTEKSTAREKLTKVQRLACLAVTSAMRSALSIALEALLDLTPLHVRIQSEAMIAGHRLFRSLGYMSRDMKRHLQICIIFPDVADVLTVSDFLPLTYSFDHPFKIIFPDRSDWHEGNYLMPVGFIAFFSDGSKKNNSVGVGSIGPGLSLSLLFGKSPSVFQAEIIAIDECARHYLSRDDIFDRDVFIFSDSQAALKALASYCLKSRLGFECLSVLKALSVICRPSLVWVPGHEGIQGNEYADELARIGSEARFIGPEPFCGLGENHI